MKKCEDNDPTSIIENVTPIHGKLTIKMLGNVVSYTDYDEETWEPIEVYKDMTICPVVYAGMSKDGITNKLTFVESNPNHVDKEEYSFTFEDAANYQYFKIVNESANAVYLSSITWGE